MTTPRGVLIGSTAIAMAIGAAGCGDGDDQRTRIANVYDDLAAAVKAGDARAVCGHLGPRANKQVRSAGHLVLQDCAAGLRPMLGELKRARDADGSIASPDLSKADVRLTAVATLSVEGRRIEVPFVEDGDEWKLDSFYGLSPRRAVAIP